MFTKKQYAKLAVVSSGHGWSQRIWQDCCWLCQSFSKALEQTAEFSVPLHTRISKRANVIPAVHPCCCIGCCKHLLTVAAHLHVQ
jgi:hypothetical protein